VLKKIKFSAKNQARFIKNESVVKLVETVPDLVQTQKYVTLFTHNKLKTSAKRQLASS
jgi:hypothetical protein